MDRPGLYVVDETGSNLRRLSTTAAISPVWSPDGRRVAYVNGGAVHVIDPAAGVDRVVADGFANRHERPSWSPDSTLLAYPGPGASSPERDIWIVPADGSASARPIPFPGDDSAVAWSSDGRLATMNGQGLWTFHPDGSGRSHVYDQPLGWGELESSRRGDVLLALPDSTATDLLVDVDGRRAPRLLGGGEAGKSAASRGDFSPDGDAVVYQGSLNWKTGLVVGPAGGGPGRLLAEWAAGPAWSPRGDLIAGVDAPENRQFRDIITLHPDATDRRTIVRVPVNLRLGEQLSWSPDGASFAFAVYDYDGPQGAVPRPTYGSGARCGEPWGTGGTGATHTETGDGYQVILGVYPCESRVGDVVTVMPELHHDGWYTTLERIDYGDGTSYEWPHMSYSCADPGPNPKYVNNSPHQYPAAGEYTVTFTMQLSSCDPATLGATREVTVSIRLYKQ